MERWQIIAPKLAIDTDRGEWPAHYRQVARVLEEAGLPV